MQRIHGQLRESGRLSMSALFKSHTNRSTLVGLFLATLELVRHHGVHLEQGELFDEIWILPGDAASGALEIAGADNYEPHDKAESKPRKARGRRPAATDNLQAEGEKENRGGG
jgi:segregation and condensation protein A